MVWPTLAVSKSAVFRLNKRANYAAGQEQAAISATGSD
jgi:hypothetical protein